MSPKHFLDIDALDRKSLRAIIDVAAAIKRKGRAPKSLGLRPGAVLAMSFEKPSTRTRVSFEVAMHQLGGDSVVLDPQDMQLGRGETLADTARALSRGTPLPFMIFHPLPGLPSRMPYVMASDSASAQTGSSRIPSRVMVGAGATETSLAQT